MKFSEDILAKFDLEASAEKEPVNVMQMCRWTVLIL